MELDQGEAYFEVAKHPEWPFIVDAGTKQVVALGTAFLVRRDGLEVSVTLVEGKVASDDIVLAPGQRLTFVGATAPRVDRPALDRETAWRRGQIILDHTTVAEAVLDMNCYSELQLLVVAPEARREEVTGIFRVGDSERFANAVAATYGLHVEHRRGQIVLSGLPEGSGRAVDQK